MIPNTVYLRLQEKYAEFLSRDLRRFITAIWRDQADYKVLVARRMFNLNEALMRLWGYEEEEEYPGDAIMSNTAFLLCGRSIADWYVYKKRFPRILICDDIMLHGRGIKKMISQFLKIVSERLEENGISFTREKLEMDLSRALVIYVYARNKEQILIDDYRIESESQLSAGELRRLSLQISGFLHDSDVANTSYVLSAEPARYQLARLFKDSVNPLEKAFIYQDRPQNVYFRLRSPRILETMRFQFISKVPEEGGILTSLVIFGDIEEKSFERLCGRVADYFQQGVRYSQVASYLRRKSEMLTRPKAQLLSFVYSILSLTEFCREAMAAEGRELYSLVVGGDFDKIVRNFDLGDIFRSEMLRLCRDVCTDQAAARPLWRLLDEAALDLVDDNSLEVSKDFSQLACPRLPQSKRIYDGAEDIFYEVGIDSEYDAYRHIRMGLVYDADQAAYDTITLDRYLNMMEKKKVSQAESLGSILGMMDSGLLSMNLEQIRTMEGEECSTVLKAGELATYVLPRRFNIFMPALAKVERGYQKKGNYVRDVLGSFIDYLQAHGYDQNGRLDRRDKKQLSALKKNKPLLLYIYSTGQTFQDWDIDLKNENTQEPGKNGRSDRFTDEEERARKAYYLECAESFLAG